MVPKERFLIVSTARSGSNQLVDYVNQTQVALCFGEIVKKTFFDSGVDSKHRQLITECFSGVDQAKDIQLSDPEQFWELVSTRVAGNHPYVGAKLFYEHREQHQLWGNIFKVNPIIIHLWRSRVLESFLSLDRAKATKQWTVRNGKPLMQRNPPIVFDEQRYLRYRDLSRARFLRIRNRKNECSRYYEVEYLQVCDPGIVGPILNDIFNARSEYSATLVKQAPDDPLDNVQNPATAQKYLDDQLDC